MTTPHDSSYLGHMKFLTSCPQREHAPLSPNAMAVLDAFLNGHVCNSADSSVAFQAGRNGLAAAIRELADQLRLELPLGDTDADAGVFASHQAIYRYLRDIATELKNAQ